MSQPASSSSAASSSSSSSGGGAAEQPLPEISDAMLERMMARKLRLLESEYAECLAATRSTDDADAADDDETRRAQAYQPFGFLPVSSPGAGGVAPADADDGDGWGEAWSEYQRVAAEERREQEEHEARYGKEEAEREEQRQRELENKPPLHRPLTQESIASIKSVMAGVRIKPPPWAIGLPESVWSSQILSRAGLGRLEARVAGSSDAASASSGSSEASKKKSRKEEKKAAKKAAKKEQKKAKKKEMKEQEQKQQQQQQQQPEETQPTDAAATAASAESDPAPEQPAPTDA